MKVTADSTWARDAGRRFFAMSDRPDRRHNNDLYTALRELGLMAQAVALLLEDEDSFVLEDDFASEAITQPETLCELAPVGAAASTNEG